MKNFAIYRRILPFSFRKILTTLLGLLLIIGLPVVVFLLTMNNESVCAVATIIGFVAGCIGYFFIARYAGYLYTCGQIAMIERGISTGELPKNIYQAGKAAVKAHFATASVYFVLRGIISGITNEITRGINALTSALDSSDNNVASTIGGVISLVIMIVLEYVNYCCLAWVFHKSNQNAFKSTCDGAVIYFQNWKTLLKNLVKIFAITLVSFLLIGLPLIIGAYILLSGFPVLVELAAVVEAELSLEPETLLFMASLVCGIILWSGLHTAFGKPLILVSVMRSYIEAGDKNPPKVDIYGKLAGISKKFRSALDKARGAGADVPA